MVYIHCEKNTEHVNKSGTKNTSKTATLKHIMLKMLQKITIR